MPRLVSFRGLFQIFPQASPTFLNGSYPLGFVHGWNLSISVPSREGSVAEVELLSVSKQLTFVCVNLPC